MQCPAMPNPRRFPRRKENSVFDSGELFYVTAIPTQIKDIGSDTFNNVLKFLPINDISMFCQVSKRFNKDCTSALLRGPSWQSKERITDNIESLMQLANESISFTPNQQLWILEAILSINAQEEQKTRDWLDIVKTKFELTTAMYHVCIRTIQNQTWDTHRPLAAEFMKFMYQKDILLPEKVNPKMLQNTETEIMEHYSSIDNDSSLLLIHESKNNRTLTELLKQPGINVNHADNRGYTALMYASENGHLEIVKKLLKQPGMDINHADNYGETALITASIDNRLHIVQELLKQSSINVNKADNDGMTPLIWASINNRVKIVRELLMRPDIDIHKADNDGRTALDWAIDNNRFKIVALLQKHIR